MQKIDSKIFLPINLEYSKSRDVICISSISDAVSRFFPEDVSRYVGWFLAAAKSRTKLDPLFDFHNRRGLFALSQNLFDDVSKWLGISGKSIFDPLANSLATAKYIRWTMEKYKKIVPDEQERFLISFLSLDCGYFKIKKAMEETLEPISFGKVKIFIKKL